MLLKGCQEGKATPVSTETCTCGQTLPNGSYETEYQ